MIAIIINKDQLQRPEATQTTQESEEQQYLENKNEKKNNCMDISNGKQAKSHTRKLKHGSERETLRESESLPIAAQNNAIQTNYVKSKLDKIQK